MLDKSFKFRKSERLCCETRIEDLFKESDSFFVYPFRVVWKIVEEERTFPAQIAISVGKKRIRTAVKRNHLKRRIREAYRLNKHILTDMLDNKSIDFMLIYMTSEMKEFEVFDRSMIKLLNKLKSDILTSEETNS
ncbi:MAG: ribonuclease P protein component [Marinifilaceae bacterium]|jgi:ribonuclease P protein component